MKWEKGKLNCGVLEALKRVPDPENLENHLSAMTEHLSGCLFLIVVKPAKNWLRTGRREQVVMLTLEQSERNFWPVVFGDAKQKENLCWPKTMKKEFEVG